MIEKIRAVQNPLTVIAIFAALAEVAGTVALATVDPSLQHTFVWFVMAFPTILVVGFFLTLNFNPKVLYAPSDFRNEDNFLNTIAGSSVISQNLSRLSEQLEQAGEKIVAGAIEQIGEVSNTQRERFAQLVSDQVSLLRQEVDSTRNSAIETTLAAAEGLSSSRRPDISRCAFCKLVQFATSDGRCRRCGQPLEESDLTLGAFTGVYPRSELQARIIDYLSNQQVGTTIEALARGIGRTSADVRRAVDKLHLRGLINTTVDSEGVPKIAIRP